jgi:hypothetical protein
MRDRVEVFRQIGVNNVSVAPAYKPVRLLDGIDRAATRAIPISAILEVRLENRFQHNLGGGLRHPVPNRRDAKRTFAATRLRDHHPPHRIGLVGLRDEFVAQACQPCFQTRRINLLESHSIHPWRSGVSPNQRVGVAQNVLAANLVVEHVEAEVGLRLRLAIELSLKAPDFIGRFKAHRQSTLYLAVFKSMPEVRALPSAGVTRPRRYYDPVRLPPGPSTCSMLKARPSTRTGLPRLPALPFQRAMPITPADQTGAYVDCFPVCMGLPHPTTGSASAS